MTKIVVLPHAALCPQGLTFEAVPGTRQVDALLEHGIDIEHVFGKVCACTTCHVHIHRGGMNLNEPIGMEEDLLDRAWGWTWTPGSAARPLSVRTNW